MQSAVDVECEYFRHSQIRTSGYGLVEISSTDPEVSEAEYRTDKNCSGSRELNQERFGTVWATPLEEWTTPNRTVMQGLLDAAGWTQSKASMRLGVSPQNFRKWLQGKHRLPFTAWYALLGLGGFLKG